MRRTRRARCRPRSEPASGSAEEERQAQAEHRTWKNNAPLLYDLVLTHALEWPSLTVQWLPDRAAPAGADYSVQRLLLGTHTEDQNYVVIAEAKLPLEGAEVDASQFDGATDFGTGVGNLRAAQLIAHEGEVNRARFMPQEPAVIATKTISGEVHVFDTRRHSNGGAPPAAGGGAAPALRLQGHAEQGFGLAWAPLQAGRLLSGSNDARVCLWDAAAAGASLHPLATFLGHEGAVGDVAWHAAEAATFASVGDDGTLRMWDARAHGAAACTSSTRAHAGEAFCLALHPTQPHLVATGGADGAVVLFDARRLSEQRLHTLEGADTPPGDVLSLGWDPRHVSVLASTCGRRVRLWELSRIGAEQRDEEEEGPPELLCEHGGHTGKVSDVAWSPHDAWTLASVAEDRQLQLWAPSEDIYNDD